MVQQYDCFIHNQKLYSGPRHEENLIRSVTFKQTQHQMTRIQSEFQCKVLDAWMKLQLKVLKLLDHLVLLRQANSFKRKVMEKYVVEVRRRLEIIAKYRNHFCNFLWFCQTSIMIQYIFVRSMMHGINFNLSCQIYFNDKYS